VKLIQDLKKIFRSNRHSVLPLVLILLVAIAGLAIALFFAHERTERDNRTDIERISESPSGYTTIDGEPFVFDTSTHEFTVVTTWATWCSLCGIHLSALSQLSRELGTGIALVAVNRKEQKSIIDSYVSEVGLPDGIIYVLDSEDFLLNATQGYSVPETILYDSSGKERNRMREPLTIETARAFISFATSSE